MTQLLVEYLDAGIEYDRSFDYATDDAAGIDLVAAENPDGPDWLIPPGDSVTIECGVAIAIPQSFWPFELYGDVRMRSGHGFKNDLSCHIGTIDPGYRGPVRVRVRNHGQKLVRIRARERFAQMIVTPFVRVEIVAVDNIERAAPSARGTAGFGSTGI